MTLLEVIGLLVIFSLGLAVLAYVADCLLHVARTLRLRRRYAEGGELPSAPLVPNGPHFLIDPETGKLLKLPNGWAEMEDHKP